MILCLMCGNVFEPEGVDDEWETCPRCRDEPDWKLDPYFVDD